MNKVKPLFWVEKGASEKSAGIGKILALFCHVPKAN